MVQVAVSKTKRCLICGSPVLKGEGCTTGYLVTESGRELINRTWFCSEDCVNAFLRFFANPVFENKKARELFMKKHPDLYAKIRGKPKLFLED